MFFIHTFELAQAISLPAVVGIHRMDGLLTLTEDRSAGEMLTPIFNPLLAHQWEGFETWPDETGVFIALRSTDQYFQFTENAWEPSASPMYYEPEFVRLHLGQWRGPLQLHLRLVRQPDGRSPRVAGCKVGYYVAASLVSYLLEFALPEFFNQTPIQLERKTYAAPDGLSIAIPGGINPKRLSKVTALAIAQQQSYPGTVEQERTPRIRLTQAMPAEQAIALIFDYQCPMTPLTQEEMFQISEFPSGTLRALEATNLHQFADTPQDWIRLADGQARSWQANYCYDAPFEATVFAQTKDEAELIAEQQIARIRRNGVVHVPPWDERVFVHMQRSIQPGPGLVGSQATHGSTKSVNYRFVLKNLPRGIWTQQDQLITRIAPIS